MEWYGKAQTLRDLMLIWFGAVAIRLISCLERLLGKGSSACPFIKYIPPRGKIGADLN